MSEQTLKEKTAKGLFWAGISSGVQQLFGILLGIYLARTLDAKDYGLIGMLAVFSGIAGTIINSGFSAALVNKKETTQKDYNAVFWFSVIVGLILYTILFFSAPFIAMFYNRPELINLSRFIFVSFFFSGIAIVPHTVMFKKIMAKQQAGIDVSAILFSAILGVYLAYKGYAYWALAVQSVAYISGGAILRCFISPWRPTFEFSIAPLKEMLPFSSKLFLTGIFQQINNNIFSVLLGKYYSATQLGYYSQGNKWMGMGHTVLIGMISQVAQPIIVEVNNDKERQLNVFRKMIRFVSFTTFPVFIGLMFVSKEFILITIGEKWTPSILFLQILCVWGIIAPFILLYNQLLIAHGKSDIYLWGNITTGITQILILLGIYNLNWGIERMAIGYVINYFLSIFFWHYYSRQFIQLRFIYLLKDIMPYLSITLFSIAVAYFVTALFENIYLILCLKIAITCLFYIVTLWLFDSKILKESIALIRK